jgi:hypothetical protein
MPSADAAAATENSDLHVVAFAGPSQEGDGQQTGSRLGG